MNPLADFLAWLHRKSAARALREAERRRAVILAQIADRKAHRREFVPKLGELRQATRDSLRASLGVQ